jgi:hypothetical protein
MAFCQEKTETLAKVKSYKINPDLSNVANLDQFGKFTLRQKELLIQNGFVVTPSDFHQLFYLYDVNDYQNLSSFITVDALLQVYHIFFDYTLRQIESEKLYPEAVDLTERMLSESIRLYKDASNPEVKKAALKNIAYFEVAYQLLTVEPGEDSIGKKTDEFEEGFVEELVPNFSAFKIASDHQVLPEVQAQVEKELELIQKDKTRTYSAIFPFQLDYSQFIIRGHYTRTERLGRYFQGLMWYGQVPFPLPYIDSSGKISADYQEQTIQAILITHSLFNPKNTNEDLVKKWEKIYEPTVFYVGSTDDLNLYNYKALIDEVYEKNLKLDEIPEKLSEFVKTSIKLSGPDIQPILIGISSSKQFRFMGQRYIPDSEMLQRLSYWPDRAFPKGLDIMAVLGSDRAYDILLNFYKENEKWPPYSDTLKILKEKFSKLDLSSWQKNLYFGWLWCLEALLKPKSEEYPFFMTTIAWQDKTLTTTCASWAELRHDTILYGKQSGAECGAEEPPPPLVKGYVEPEVEFYSRLEWLTGFTKKGLESRDILNEKLKAKFIDMENLILFLKKISIKELNEEALSEEEYNRIRYFGGELGNLTLSAAEALGGYLTGIDEDIAVIADVHTSGDACLEEGVGHANEIYVIIPIEGKLYLTRGAVFSYYEFIYPISDRLTDEKWQKMLKDNKAPNPPDWVNSYMGDKKREIPNKKKE